MQIHSLKNPNKKSRKRIGRGGKRGSYSGRGQKGQKSRSGHRIRPAMRDLMIRIPKLRGVKHGPVREKSFVINVSDLSRVAEGGLVNKEILVKKKIIKKTSQPVKVLGSGNVKESFTIEGLSVSDTAKEKILKSGGTIK